VENTEQGGECPCAEERSVEVGNEDPSYLWDFGEGCRHVVRISEADAGGTDFLELFRGEGHTVNPEGWSLHRTDTEGNGGTHPLPFHIFPACGHVRLLAWTGDLTVGMADPVHISSAGLGLLPQTKRRQGEAGFGMRLANLRQPVHKVFVLSGFGGIFGL